jgi:hypothetical protein
MDQLPFAYQLRKMGGDYGEDHGFSWMTEGFGMRCHEAPHGRVVLKPQQREMPRRELVNEVQEERLFDFVRSRSCRNVDDSVPEGLKLLAVMGLQGRVGGDHRCRNEGLIFGQCVEREAIDLGPQGIKVIPQGLKPRVPPS